MADALRTLVGAEQYGLHGQAQATRFGQIPGRLVQTAPGVVTATLQTVAGSGAAAGADAVLELLRNLAPELYSRFNLPFRTGYGGGSLQAVEGEQFFRQVVTGQTNRMIGQRVAGVVGETVSDQTANQLGGLVNAIATLGGGQDILAAAMPDTVVDHNPLMQAYLGMGGDLSDRLSIERFVDRFERSFSSGAFGPNAVKQFAANAYQVTAAAYGGLNDDATAAAAYRTADVFATAGFGTHGQGLAIASQLGQDELRGGQGIGQIAELEALRRRVGIAGAEAIGYGEAASQQYGGSLLYQARAGLVGRTAGYRLGGQAGRPDMGQYRERVGRSAATAYSSLTQSDSMKVLVAYANLNPSVRGQIRQAIQAGDHRAISRFTSMAMRDGAAMAGRSAVTPEQISGFLGDVDSMQGSIRSELDRYADRYLKGDPEAYRQYSALINGEPVAGKTLVTRKAEGDWSGVTPRVAQLLGDGGPTGGKAGAVALATQGTGGIREQTATVMTETAITAQTRQNPMDAIGGIVKSVIGAVMGPPDDRAVKVRTNVDNDPIMPARTDSYTVRDTPRAGDPSTLFTDGRP